MDLEHYKRYIPVPPAVGEHLTRQETSHASECAATPLQAAEVLRTVSASRVSHLLQEPILVGLMT